MRKSILSLAVVALLASCGGTESTEKTTSNEATSESFKVYGNCGMCEKTIEGSLQDLDGVSKANWNKETKQMDVEFDASKIKLADIKQKIANLDETTKVRISQYLERRVPRYFPGDVAGPSYRE